MPTTTIAGTRYDMGLLTGREARTVGLIVTSAALRALAVALAKADLSSLLSKVKGPDGEISATSLKALIETMAWPEIAKNLGALGEGGAALLETIDASGLEALDRAFTAKTVAFIKSEHPSDTNVYPTPLSNRDDYWTGKWMEYLQWLAWGVRVNGFLGDWTRLGARSPSPTGTAGAPESKAST
jgi:hypothetical protein